MDNFQERFYQMMTRLKSRAASSTTEARITEMINGVIVTRPVKKYQEITTNNEVKTTSEPQVIDLQDYAKSQSKAGSVPTVSIR